MSNFSESFGQLKSLVEEIQKDEDKIEKGVKKAARRVRKNLSEIGRLTKDCRKDALEAVRGDEEEEA